MKTKEEIKADVERIIEETPNLLIPDELLKYTLSLSSESEREVARTCIDEAEKAKRDAMRRVSGRDH